MISIFKYKIVGFTIAVFTALAGITMTASTVSAETYPNKPVQLEAWWRYGPVNAFICALSV